MLVFTLKGEEQDWGDLLICRIIFFGKFGNVGKHFLKGNAYNQAGNGVLRILSVL